MRTVLVLLLLANLTLFAYTRLDVGSGGEAMRLAEQVQPDKIKLLTPQEVAALGPAKVAALADVCVEWGPFGDAERAKALADLEPLGIGKLVSQRRVDVAGLWSPMLTPFSSRAAADRRAGELRAMNLRDVAVVDVGGGRYTVAIGAFRTEDAANAYASDLARLGVALPAATRRAQPVSQTLLVVRDPPANAVARMRELSSGYPGAELKVGTCDRA
ncbi:MAG TPA: SPOR domain-containing protein [Casimicrobiaceae bacterium]|nr:SPOR domain-containing protein [Casimicrobiaceae bacterium]